MEKEKVVSIEDRIPKLKESRKKKANRRLLFYLSIFFVLIAIIVYLQSPLSQIRHVDIKGNQVLADDEIVAKSGLSKGENIWMLNDTKAKEKVESHPLIKEATVKRKLPQSVEVKVDEYQIVGYIENDGAYYPLLEDGELLTEPIENKGDEPLLHDFKQNDYLKRLAGEIEDVPEDIFNLISEITWNPTEKNKYKIILYMNDGFVVKTTIRNFASKMESYPAVIAQLDDGKKGIIHMEVGTYFEEFTD